MNQPNEIEGQSSVASAESIIQSLSHLRVDADQLVFHGTTIDNSPFYTTRVAELKPTPTSTVTLVYVKQLHHRKHGQRNLRGEQLMRLARQLIVWAGLAHPNLLPLIGFFLDDAKSESWIIVPSLPRGDLLQYIIQSSPEEAERLKLATDIALGVNYLHHRTPPIAHGDIRASNVFLSDEGRAVVGDFGLARLVEDQPTGLTTTGGNSGAIRWMSQELLIGDEPRPTTYSDVWAWGCLLLELLTGKEPYSSVKHPSVVILRICSGVPPAAVESLQVPDSLRRLLSQCWSQVDKNRPRMEVVAATLMKIMNRSTPPTAVSTLIDVKGNLRGSLQQIVIFNRGIRSDVAKALWIRADAMSFHVAAKILRPHDYRGNSGVEKILAQRVVEWGGLSHRNLLSVFGMMAEPQLCLLFPWCDKGDFLQYLRNDQTLNITTKLRLLKQIASAVAYLHSRSPPIIHHGIHPEHILLSDSGEALLSGCHLEGVVEIPPKTQEDGGPDFSSYLIPEELNGKFPTTASDVYSFGCLMLEVLSEKRPFWQLNPGRAVISAASGKLPDRQAHPLLPPGDLLWNVIEHAMAGNPDDRPTMTVTFNEACYPLLLVHHRQLISYFPQLNIQILDRSVEVQGSERGSDGVQNSSLGSNFLSYLDPSSAWANDDVAEQEIQGILSVDSDAPVWTGGFANVCKGTWTPPTGENRLVAIKYLRAPNRGDPIPDTHPRKAAIAQLVKREAFIWSRARHRYIAPLLGFGLGDQPCLVSPWYQNGNLTDFLQRNPELTTADKLRLVYQTAEALVYLHSLSPPITHGDIKPSNVLISDMTEAQLSDFGLSQLLQDSTENAALQGGLIGTKGYQAPELIFGGTCTLETDVFALGSCLVTAISGQAPFQNLNGPRTVLALNKGELPSQEMHPGLTPALWSIVARCWSLDPAKRPTAPEILEELEKELTVLSSQTHEAPRNDSNQ